MQQRQVGFLAAENHFVAWVERKKVHQAELQERLVVAGLPCDVSTAVQIAKWLYLQIEKANGQVWVMEKVLRHLDQEWAKCFTA